MAWSGSCLVPDVLADVLCFFLLYSLLYTYTYTLCLAHLCIYLYFQRTAPLSCPLHLRLSTHLLLVVKRVNLQCQLVLLHPTTQGLLLKVVVQPVNRMNVSVLHSFRLRWQQFNAFSRHSIQ